MTPQTIDIDRLEVNAVADAEPRSLAASIEDSLRPHLLGAAVDVTAVAEALADRVVRTLEGG